MKLIVSIVIAFFMFETADAQYDHFLSTIINVPQNKPTSLGEFEIKKGITAEDIISELDSDGLNIKYYQPRRIDCGFFVVNQKVFETKYSEPLFETFGCDLDLGSLDAYRYELGNKKYLIITAIGMVSGRGTRIVFCHLFDITNRAEIKNYFFWSLYGSRFSFGDYNNDLKIDFLETRYDYGNDKSDDQQRMKITPLLFNDIKNTFERDESHFLVFERTDTPEFPTKVISKKWFD